MRQSTSSILEHLRAFQLVHSDAFEGNFVFTQNKSMPQKSNIDTKKLSFLKGLPFPRPIILGPSSLQVFKGFSEIWDAALFISPGHPRLFEGPNFFQQNVLRFETGKVSKNRGIYTPKWMVKIMENPINSWMIWGENPPFKETPIQRQSLRWNAFL